MEIWEKIAEDPEEGARRLVSEYGNRLICVAEILCGEHAFAEDLVFVTFRKAIAKTASFDARYSFWNWLYTILLNEFRSTLRKKKAEVLDEKSQDASLLDGEDRTNDFIGGFAYLLPEFSSDYGAAYEAVREFGEGMCDRFLVPGCKPDAALDARFDDLMARIDFRTHCSTGAVYPLLAYWWRISPE